MSELMDAALAKNVRVAAAALAKAMDDAVQAGLRVQVKFEYRRIISPPAEAQNCHHADITISRPL